MLDFHVTHILEFHNGVRDWSMVGENGLMFGDVYDKIQHYCIL